MVTKYKVTWDSNKTQTFTTWQSACDFMKLQLMAGWSEILVSISL